MVPSSPIYDLPGVLEERFAAFIDHARWYRNHSPATIKWYQQAFRMLGRHLAQSGAGQLSEANAASLIEQWVVEERAHGLSPFTIRSQWQAMRAFFVYLERTDQFANPFKVLSAPAVPDAEPKARTPEECIRILEAAKNADWSTTFERARAAAMIGIAIYAGLRRAEIVKLRFTDVDLDTGRITVVRGKGRGGGKDRTLYAPPDLITLLRVYVAERRRSHFDAVELFNSGHGTGVSLSTAVQNR